MPQTAYLDAMVTAFAGIKADTEFDFVASLIAKEIIRPGLGLVKFAGVDNAARLPLVNEVTISWDIDFTATNVISGIVNGVAYEETWNTNHATTLTALTATLLAIPGVLSATEGTNSIVLLADPNGALTATCAVAAGGGSSPVSTVTDTTTDLLHAIALHTHTLEARTVNPVVLDKSTITLSTDLTGANSTVVTVNGTALTAVVYATSHAVSMTLLCAEIDSAPGVYSCSYVGDVVTVLAPLGLTVTVNSVVVTGGAAVTAAIVASSQTVEGEVYYPAMSTVSGLRDGAVYVTVEEIVTSDDPVYVRYKTSGTDLPGQFRKDADSSTAFLVAGAKYRTGAAALGVAIVEINLP